LFGLIVLILTWWGMVYDPDPHFSGTWAAALKKIGRGHWRGTVPASDKKVEDSLVDAMQDPRWPSTGSVDYAEPEGGLSGMNFMADADWYIEWGYDNRDQLTIDVQRYPIWTSIGHRLGLP